MSVEVGPFAVDLAKALILSLLGATAALAVHAGAAVYQDGLRTSVPELWQGGRDRRALAAFSYTISIGFIVAYALPYSLATGIVIIHIILLEIDTIGLRFERRTAAVGIGFAYAASRASPPSSSCSGSAVHRRRPRSLSRWSASSR